MKKTITALYLFGIILLSGCGQGVKEDGQEPTNVPEAFQEDSFKDKLKSYSRSKSYNPLDQMFDEYLINDSVLKAELIEYEKLEEKIRENKEGFNEFDGNNFNYFKAARNLAIYMSDSIIVKNMLKYIEEKENNYKELIKNNIEVDSLITNKRDVISNTIKIIKLEKTMEMMEKYQKSNVPSTEKLRENNEELDDLKQRFEKKQTLHSSV